MPKRSAEEILAEYVATDMLREMNSPSVIRVQFLGSPADRQALYDHHRRHYKRMDELLEELSECDSK